MANPNCGACGHMNTRGFCNLTACIFPCHTGMGGYINKPMTNADRIRQMSDEELATFLSEATSNAIVILGIGSRKKSKSAFDWYGWLKSPEVDNG